MLRNYDKIGLLIPAHVDDISGYRYYEENQLVTANRIQALKAMGLGLDSIKEIIHSYSDSKSLSEYLNIQYAIKKEELKKLQSQLNQLETTINSLETKGNILRYSIEVKEIPKRKVASVRNIISSYNKEGDLWEILFSELEKQKIQPSYPSYNLALFHDYGFVENNIDVEIQHTVVSYGEDTDFLKFKTAKPMLAAVLTYEGNYKQISEISKLIAEWVNENHYAFSGPHFNIYHNSPATEKCKEKMVTEVGFPIVPC